jgi:hypothetical protein
MSNPITYLGHVSVLIEMNGMRLLTDPILRNWVWHLRRRSINIDSAWLFPFTGERFFRLVWAG